ncbi:MAG: hypothetical protein ACRDTD_30045 [Pseudonocardiaceae bacterium]
MGWSAKQAQDATDRVVERYNQKRATDDVDTPAQQPDVSGLLKQAIAALGQTR